MGRERVRCAELHAQLPGSSAVTAESPPFWWCVLRPIRLLSGSLMKHQTHLPPPVTSPIDASHDARREHLWFAARHTEA